MSLIKKTIVNNNLIDSEKLDTMMILQGKIMAELNKQKTSKNIQDYEFKVFSQNGEDGIIQHLIDKIDVKNKTFIEFGVESYQEANTRFLIENDNWSGLIIDGSEEYMNGVKYSTLGWKRDIKAVAKFIDKDNINDIFKDAGMTGEIGILSVDIDGNDYWVFKAIDCVNPQILIMEYNSLFGANDNVTVPYDKNFVRGNAHYSNLYYGASIGALTKIANERGYDLVGSNSFGNNIFFVRHDCNTLGISLTAKEAYVKSKFKESRNEEGALTYLGHEEALKMLSEMDLYDISNDKLIKIKDLSL